jgi:hypothetical protein
LTYYQSQSLSISHIIMNFLQIDSNGQQPSKLGASAIQASSPFLQDSGYASEPNNPFEGAFNPQFSPEERSYAHFGYSSFHDTCAPADTDLTLQKQLPRPPMRHQQSMPVLPHTCSHPVTYQSLDRYASRLSIDASINSMTGYCDIDSLLAAAYGNTCTTQTDRFKTFASQYQLPIRASQTVVSVPSTPPPPFRKPAYPELGNIVAPIQEALESPIKASSGRHRSHSTHTEVE